MRIRWAAAAGIFSLIFLAAAAGLCAGGPGANPPGKTGVLLVTFGSSRPSTQASYNRIERRVKQAYPGIPVKWAYTSRMIRSKMVGRGKRMDSPETALSAMMDQGYAHVAVQSLHIIEGEEFQELRRTVAAFRAIGGFDAIALGKPLLAGQEDMQAAVEAILNSLPKDRSRTEGVVLVGHGTAHPSNAFYAALMFQLQLKDPNVFIGTVEGYPQVETIKELLLARKVESVCLMPFMSVAGGHAVNDMAGHQEGSWESVLTRAGIRCRSILKGAADYDAFVDIWISHLGLALRQCSFDNP